LSAARSLNPNAIRIIHSGYPDMESAAASIVAQADSILVKPGSIKDLVPTIKSLLEKGRGPIQIPVSVATILEYDTQATINDWLSRVNTEATVLIVKMNNYNRSDHLPHLFRDLVCRLRNPLPLGIHASVSPAAVEHGRMRREQGYTPAMIVEESRMLQVSIFQTLQNNLAKVDFNCVLIGVMAIADEIDSQLAQTMTGFYEAA